MPRTISQSVLFAAPPREVYALYADQKLHAEVTGAAAVVKAKAGSELQWACLTYNIMQWIRLVWRRPAVV